MFFAKVKFIIKTTVLLVPLLLRFYLNKYRANRQWRKCQSLKLGDTGKVHNLTILPLAEAFTVSSSLEPDSGPSYLIKADDTTILFDCGLNRSQKHPSPLLHNITQLGVDLSQIKYVVISHLHSDHVGGRPQAANKTFNISPQEIDLRNVASAYVPVKMHHPQIKDVTVVDKPLIIAPGVASEGTIARALFFLGYTLEQALAINVDRKGIFLIIGCGHQGLRKIIMRAEQLFKAPIYGMMGGLHFPVTGARLVENGMNKQMFFGTGKLPWQRIKKSEVYDTIAYLKTKKLSIISLSAHDSCDWSVSAFREAFPNTYQECAVGKQISV
jgi:7,8-dihydropterin-6-yl-methyl-4-(beta-D-ribofuranosyl)aminobenzene 5'-phosphate synthase